MLEKNVRRGEKSTDRGHSTREEYRYPIGGVSHGSNHGSVVPIINCIIHTATTVPLSLHHLIASLILSLVHRLLVSERSHRPLSLSAMPFSASQLVVASNAFYCFCFICFHKCVLTEGHRQSQFPSLL